MHQDYRMSAAHTRMITMESYHLRAHRAECQEDRQSQMAPGEGISFWSTEESLQSKNNPTGKV